MESYFGMRSKSKSARNLCGVGELKKSKNKNNKQRGISKSQYNLKLSSEIENYSSQVFT